MGNLKTGGVSASASASKPSPRLKPATSATPRMLTPSEIESLRRNKQETAAIVKAFLAEQA